MSDTYTDDDLMQDDDRDTDLVKTLRNQLRDAKKRSKEADELREKLTTYERKEALRDAGLTLNDKQLRALQAAHDGDFDAESIRQTAVELGFAAAPEPSETDEALEAQERITAASAGAGPAQGGVITPDTFLSWPTDKRREFMAQHPRATDALKRGEEVTGIQF